MQEFWTVPSEELLRQLETTPQGLSSAEAAERLKRFGENLLKPRKRANDLALFLGQFKSPIILILLAAVGVSFFLRDTTDAIIILAIVLASGILGFVQERGATNAVRKLLEMVKVRASVMRDRAVQKAAVEEIVPGDVVVLDAGDVIPSDCLLLESRDLFVNEASLTGETFPVEKAEAGPKGRALFMGTSVVSGTAQALVVRTGKETEFGKVSERLKLRPAENEFERGVRQFGQFLMEVTLLLVVAIFAINVFLKKPVLDSFLFALALAVGLTPQLLPAIISVNLAHGARRMARKKVIVKRLVSIENFGSMDVLCSDKTGTLTEGKVRVHAGLDIDGNPSEKTIRAAWLNAHFESGFANPIDEAIRSYRQFDVAGITKQDEVPYDFARKRLSVLVQGADLAGPKAGNVMITKGALDNVLSVCTQVECSDGHCEPLSAHIAGITGRFKELSSQGFRVLGVAYRAMGDARHAGKEHETEMVFLGFLVLFDPPKTGIADTLNDLRRLGVTPKVITGDNRLVAANISRQVGIPSDTILTGSDILAMSDEALVRQAPEVSVFAEVEPNHKERIILALKKAGHVTGFMGDGINDASALHAADVGISVDSAVDVARDAADIVLLEKDLEVLVDGVEEGRITFANTLKYVFMATSANFGNMFSMAGASLFLPFLPLLPKQILLTNLLTDLPEMTIANDNVDSELVTRPRRWDIRFIRRFMIVFGLLSSVFDYLTFGVLILMLRASPVQFRTGWFIESVISAALVVLVIRTRRSFFKSRPSRTMLLATLFVFAVVLILPLTPAGRIFGFAQVPVILYPLLLGIIALYAVSAEVAKRIFYRHVRHLNS